MGPIPSFLRHGLVLALVLLFGACQTERAAVGPEGELSILDASRQDGPGGRQDGWQMRGSEAGLRQGLAFVRLAGTPVLRVASGPESFVAVKATSAVLQASPYLTWSWNAEPHGPQGHAASLVVGFRGGGGRAASAGDLPAHDRLLVLAWGGSALERGSFPNRNGNGPARYVVRGGREQADSWHEETVDLAALYAQAWPGDDLSRATVAFVGVGAPADQAPGILYFSRIRLTR